MKGFILVVGERVLYLKRGEQRGPILRMKTLCLERLRRTYMYKGRELIFVKRLYIEKVTYIWREVLYSEEKSGLHLG